MAGLSFLYAYYNLYSISGGQGVPTFEEAMTDIEACLAVLDYLTREFAAVCNRCGADKQLACRRRPRATTRCRLYPRPSSSG